MVQQQLAHHSSNAGDPDRSYPAHTPLIKTTTLSSSLNARSTLLDRSGGALRLNMQRIPNEDVLGELYGDEIDLGFYKGGNR